MIHARITDTTTGKVIGYIYHDGEGSTLGQAAIQALAEANVLMGNTHDLKIDAYFLTPAQLASLGAAAQPGILLPPSTPTRAREA